MLKYERGRVQTDGEYKYLFETIKNHMHRAGHVIQIIPPQAKQTSIKSRKCTPSILQLSRKLLSIRWSMEALTSES